MMRDVLGALPPLLVFVGVGLLFLVVVAGFLPAVYWICLPSGLVLFFGGLGWEVVRLYLRATAEP